MTRKVLLNPSGAALRAYGGVMSGKGSPYFMPGYRGVLSIKTVIRGAGLWTTPSCAHRVDPDHALILNHDQTYTLEIDGADGPIETFCPFFSIELVREAAAARRYSREALLDELDPQIEIPTFVERLQRPTPRLASGLARLRVALRLDPDLAVTRMHELVDVVLDTATEERTRIATLDAARVSTREETYRRVHRAVDWAHANLEASIELADLATISRVRRGDENNAGPLRHRAAPGSRATPAPRYTRPRHRDLFRRGIREPGIVLVAVQAPVRNDADNVARNFASLKKRTRPPPS